MLATTNKSRRIRRLTPLGLHSEEDPDPSPEYLQTLHHENATLEIIEMVQMRAELDAPGAPEEEIHDDHRVVHLLGMEPPLAAKSPRMLGVTSFGGKQRKVPIFCDVPVERVKRIR